VEKLGVHPGAATFSEDESRYSFQTPYKGESLGFLFAMVFGVAPGVKTPRAVPPELVPLVAQAVEHVLLTLTPREERVLRMRVGLMPTGEEGLTWQRIADHFGVSRHKIKEIEEKALRKLRHYSRANILKEFLDARYEPLWLNKGASAERLAELIPIIEKVKRLEPSLIAHLQQHKDDLQRIHPILFEHLFAEFLAARGFSDVRLVGRNPRTSADIFAAKFDREADIPFRLFVEVKRWKDTVGIEVIDQVLGAFVHERERFGWSAAMIVSLGGFKDFHKWTRPELELKGLYLKERDDLLRYLEGYKQHPNGLWLPNPRTDL
jgi:DNA-binding CsgD family transcriptional regulator